MNKEQIKVFFIQKNRNGEFETESLWCTKIGENFLVDNIPFIANRISLGDTIKAEYDEEDKQYYFDDFVMVSVILLYGCTLQTIPKWKKCEPI